MSEKKEVPQKATKKKTPVKKPTTRKPRVAKKETPAESRVVIPFPAELGKVVDADVLGVAYQIKSHIPSDEKTRVAMSITEHSVVPDEKIGTAFLSVEKDVEMALGLIDGYTNIKVPLEDRVDFYSRLSAHGVIDRVLEVAASDWLTTMQMAQVFIENVIKRLDRMNSIDHFFKEMSSGSAQGEELLRLISKANSEQSEVGDRINERIDELNEVKAPRDNIIDFSKRDI